MKPEKFPPVKMGKRGRLAMVLVWTVIALAVLYVLLFMTSGGTAFSRLCGIALIFMCLAGQWLRWWKFR